MIELIAMAALAATGFVIFKYRSFFWLVVRYEFAKRKGAKFVIQIRPSDRVVLFDIYTPQRDGKVRFPDHSIVDFDPNSIYYNSIVNGQATFHITGQLSTFNPAEKSPPSIDSAKIQNLVATTENLARAEVKGDTRTWMIIGGAVALCCVAAAILGFVNMNALGDIASKLDASTIHAAVNATAQTLNATAITGG